MSQGNFQQWWQDTYGDRWQEIQWKLQRQWRRYRWWYIGLGAIALGLGGYSVLVGGEETGDLSQEKGHLSIVDSATYVDKQQAKSETLYSRGGSIATKAEQDILPLVASVRDIERSNPLGDIFNPLEDNLGVNGLASSDNPNKNTSYTTALVKENNKRQKQVISTPRQTQAESNKSTVNPVTSPAVESIRLTGLVQGVVAQAILAVGSHYYILAAGQKEGALEVESIYENGVTVVYQGKRIWLSI